MNLRKETKRILYKLIVSILIYFKDNNDNKIKEIYNDIIN